MTNFTTTQEREIIGSASFSVSARVAMQLGRESISNSIVGILELIKNAYDADAENVTLYFLDLDSEYSTLIIDDDGHGMNERAVLSNWLVIGTDNKRQQGTSRVKKRVLTGEKGLGRLALDRLCETTLVQSFVADRPDGIELAIDWRKYENTDVRLETIEHPITRLNNRILLDPRSNQPFEKEHGTRLVLSGLKDKWAKDAIEQLRQELSLLVSPFVGINDFSIELSARGNYEQVGSTEVLEAAEWQLSSTLTDNGFLNHRMSSRDGQNYEFSEAWRAVFPDTEFEIPLSGPVEFVMYFIPRQVVDGEGFSFSRAQIDTFMDANQGIRIYRDDFRVKPYGDPSGSGDWLNLAYRRQQHPTSRGGTGWRVGYNQVVGAVFLKRGRNEGLLDQTNREGILEGVAFTHLKLFALHAVEWFERNQVVSYRASNRKRRFEQAQSEATRAENEARAATENLESVITTAVNVLDGSIEGTNNRQLDDIRENLSRAMEVVKESVERTFEAREELTKAHEEEKEETEEEKNTLHNLASLGILAVAFGHETLSHSNLLVGNSKMLKAELTPLTLSVLPYEIRKMLEEGIDDIEFSAKRIHAFGNFMLRNMRRDKRKRVKVYLDRIINDVLNSFELNKTRNVTVELDFPSKTPAILAFIVDWESIIVNFLTNSLWALLSVVDRKIRIRLREEDDQLNLWFADNGTGISKGTIDHIFEPTFTTKRNDKGDKIGTGMGLSIVDELVRSYGGSINVASPSDYGGAEFHVKVPITRTAEKGVRR